MKALETHYNGYKFRSRTEARWAIFFDCLGLTWFYEPEGFLLDNGQKYLPDFYLPDLAFGDGMYFEVKGVKPTTAEKDKCENLARGTGKPVLLAIGPPNEQGQIMVFGPALVERVLYFFAEDTRTDGEFWLVGMDGDCGCSIGPIRGEYHEKYPYESKTIKRAYWTAKSARFEGNDREFYHAIG